MTHFLANLDEITPRMEKEPITKEKKSPSLGLIKTAAIIVIVRESLTILFTYVVKSNAEYGLNQPDQKFEERVNTIIAWGVGILLTALVYLVDKTIITLLILIAVFTVELAYQFSDGFFEFWYFVSTPLIVIFLLILLYKSIKK
jgi:hypothetical protein